LLSYPVTLSQREQILEGIKNSREKEVLIQWHCMSHFLGASPNGHRKMKDKKKLAGLEDCWELGQGNFRGPIWGILLLNILFNSSMTKVKGTFIESKS
jgi:hypothetical protein